MLNKEKLEQLLSEGKPALYIAGRLGMSKDSVYDYKRKLGYVKDLSICVFETCGKIEYCRGLCRNHYEQYRYAQRRFANGQNTLEKGVNLNQKTKRGGKVGYV